VALCIKSNCSFSADRTNYGRAYATVLRLASVCRLSLSRSVSILCDVCIEAKRCVLEQKLLVTTYRKSYVRNRIGTKMNNIDLL